MAKNEELKSLLMRVKEENKNSLLEIQHSKNKDHDIWSHHFIANRGKMEAGTDFVSLGSKSLQTVTAVMKLKHTYIFKEKL